ncbi:Rid family hydrolase [Roseibium sp. HPY-6]|uniref:Rid family hydrolase n=1 Tax=Roseibium sp. HPY-6 TaxID=3229852 RepID=UPI00338E449B
MKIETFNTQPTFKTFEPYHLSLGAKANGFLFVTGQVGFEDDGTLPEDDDRQVENVFRHLDRILADAGAEWANVVQMRSYHLDKLMETQALKILEEKRKRMPDDQHAWTAIGVTHLMPAGSRVEIDVTVAMDS